MTLTLDVEPELARDLADQARDRGVSLEVYLHAIVTKQVRDAHISPTRKPAIPELPVRHLGAVASLHRRDIYDDAD